MCSLPEAKVSGSNAVVCLSGQVSGLDSQTRCVKTAAC